MIDGNIRGYREMETAEAFRVVGIELGKAGEQFGPFHSNHEGLGAVLEEYREFETEVFKSGMAYSSVRARGEASHLAAMAIRFMVDCT